MSNEVDLFTSNNYKILDRLAKVEKDMDSLFQLREEEASQVCPDCLILTTISETDMKKRKCNYCRKEFKDKNQKVIVTRGRHSKPKPTK